jgi:hypothetical protein
MGRPHRLLLAAGLLTLLLPLSAAGAAPQPPSQGAAATVEMGSNYYAPREVRVDVGGP